MDLKRLLGLRPKGDTLADLTATHDRVNAELAALDERIAGFAQRRGELLLDGQPETVARAEAELAAAEAERGRLAAMLPVLKARVDAAREAEAIAEVRRIAAETEEAAEAFASWYRTTYPKVAAALVEGLRLEAEALDKRQALDRLGVQRLAGVVERMPLLPIERVLPGKTPDRAVGDMVQLPPVEWQPGQEPRLTWPEPRN